jgi:hypothetical protein
MGTGLATAASHAEATMTKTVKLAFAMNLLMGGLLVGGAGCDAERGDDAATAGTQPTAERSPELVASLTLDNGNPLEFYDFGTGALVSEVGMADSTSPRFNPEEHALVDLTTIWRSLIGELFRTMEYTVTWSEGAVRIAGYSLDSDDSFHNLPPGFNYSI